MTKESVSELERMRTLARALALEQQHADVVVRLLCEHMKQN